MGSPWGVPWVGNWGGGGVCPWMPGSHGGRQGPPAAPQGGGCPGPWGSKGWGVRDPPQDIWDPPRTPGSPQGQQPRHQPGRDPGRAAEEAGEGPAGAGAQIAPASPGGEPRPLSHGHTLFCIAPPHQAPPLSPGPTHHSPAPQNQTGDPLLLCNVCISLIFIGTDSASPQGGWASWYWAALATLPSALWCGCCSLEDFWSPPNHRKGPSLTPEPLCTSMVLYSVAIWGLESSRPQRAKAAALHRHAPLLYGHDPESTESSRP